MTDSRWMARAPQCLAYSVTFACIVLCASAFVASPVMLERLAPIAMILLTLSVAAALVIARDAEQHRKMAEDALEKLSRESEDRMRAERAVDTFFSVSITPMCVLGFDGFARRLNAPWETILERPLAELLARRLIDFVHDEDKAATASMLVDLEHGAKVIGFENRMRTVTGGVRWLSWNATVIPAEQVVVVNAKDITERKAMELINETKTAKLMRSNADLERFAFMASHDLQEPLRMVASFAQQLSKHYKGQLDLRADRYINYVVDGALRMQSMISSLLSYSRLEQCDPKFEWVICDDTLRVALRNLQASIVEAEAEVSSDPLPSLHADAALLAHVFQNLIGNAIKFRGDGAPKVHISAQKGEGEWIFLVEDQGIGIRSEDAERVFGLFQRLHSKAEYPGSGMGLAICQKIVHRHGGRIWVDSEVGQGARFHFSIRQQPNPHWNQHQGAA